jgi:cell division protein FtsZ
MINIPEIPLENFQVPEDEVTSALGLINTYEGSLDFGVIGSGQAGCRIAKSFFDLGYQKSIAVNTSLSDLNPLEMPAEQKLRIGHLEGSGKSMEKGARAAQESSQQVFDKMRQVFGNVDKIIICVGFGGGTGAGSCPVLISIATKYLDYLKHVNPAKDVIVIAALPTDGELKSATIQVNNKKVQEDMFDIADQGLIGPVILIDNAKIEKLYRGIPPTKFWPSINDTITGLFQMFNYLSKQESGYTTFDREDYKTVLTTPGLAVLGVTRVDLGKDEQLSQALQDNLKKTLLADMVDYTTARESACVVVAGTEVMDTISMDVINYGFDTISNLIGNANVHRGLYDTDGDLIRAYTMITGCSPVVNRGKI